MSDSIHQPHDKLFKAVFSDPTEAAEFLSAYLPESIKLLADWQTLRLMDGSFVDEALRNQESDLLFHVQLQEHQKPIFLYLLFEHQSQPLKWMRRRLHKYLDRIWDESFKQQPEQEYLPLIIPLVFYQGATPWNYSTEFADLFPEIVRQWEFAPRFSHILIDQSNLDPENVHGGLRAKVLQLLMYAAYHEPVQDALRLAAQLLAKVPETEGINYFRIFVRYMVATQPREMVTEFSNAVEQFVTDGRGKVMTYAEELFREGEIRGEIRGELKTKVELIDKLLHAGVSWVMIEQATDINAQRYLQLKDELAQLIAMSRITSLSDMTSDIQM